MPPEPSAIACLGPPWARRGGRPQAWGRLSPDGPPRPRTATALVLGALPNAAPSDDVITPPMASKPRRRMPSGALFLASAAFVTAAASSPSLALLSRPSRFPLRLSCPLVRPHALLTAMVPPRPVQRTHRPAVRSRTSPVEAPPPLSSSCPHPPQHAHTHVHGAPLRNLPAQQPPHPRPRPRQHPALPTPVGPGVPPVGNPSLHSPPGPAPALQIGRAHV